MRWTSDGIAKYNQHRLYVDTAILPVCHFKNELDDINQQRLYSQALKTADELEKRFSGRMLLYPLLPTFGFISVHHVMREHGIESLRQRFRYIIVISTEALITDYVNEHLIILPPYDISNVINDVIKLWKNE